MFLTPPSAGRLPRLASAWSGGNTLPVKDDAFGQSLPEDDYRSGVAALGATLSGTRPALLARSSGPHSQRRAAEAATAARRVNSCLDAANTQATARPWCSRRRWP